MGMRKDFGEVVARSKCAPVPENWGIVEWERCGRDAVIYRGAEYTHFVKGPRKGQKKWGKTNRHWECVVTTDEIKRAEKEWEIETGKCARCGGDGQEWIGWNRETGNRFQTCTRCIGDGKSVWSVLQLPGV